jgi:hypothetical protein
MEEGKRLKKYFLIYSREICVQQRTRKKKEIKLIEKI